MSETEKENVAPANQAEAERFRLLQPAFDRFEGRHYVGLAASVALHLAVLMGLKWAIHPQPPRPLIVEVEMLPAEPVKASPHYQVAKSKPSSALKRVRQKVKPPKPAKVKPVDLDQEMNMEVVRAAPASQRKRAGKATGASPVVALPDTSSSRRNSSQAIPGQAAAASAYQKAEQRHSLKPSIASTAQQASSRFQSSPETGVEKERGPVLIASNVPASQTLSPEYRHSSKRKKDFSSQGGSRNTAMGGGPRSESAQPYSLQSSSSGASSLASGNTHNGTRTSTPLATSNARTAGLSPKEVGAAVSQTLPTTGASLSPEQVRGTGTTTDRVASAIATASQSNASGSPTEIQSHGGQQAAAAGSTVSPGQARVSGSGAGGVASLNSSGGSSKGMPGEEGGSVALQGSARGIANSMSGRGSGTGDFSQSGGGPARSTETAVSGGGQLVTSAETSQSIGPAVQSMSAVIVPERGTARVSRVADDYGTANLQRVQPQAITHQIENERYESKSLKVNSPKTICELPLMLAGFDRKPLPEGLATIMGSESAMVMEAPPELLPGNLQPTYPPGALVGNHKGVVTIRAQVLTNGQVGEMFVRPPRAAQVLEQAAMNTVRRWRFKPARRNGEPVPAWVNIPIEYRNPT